MKNILSALPLFVEVARQHSFTQAAESLDMPLPTESRRISALEKELGVQLLARTRRKVELTSAGRLFFERCEHIVEEANLALEHLQEERNKPAGSLRLVLSVPVYYTYLKETPGRFVGGFGHRNAHASVHALGRHPDKAF